MDKFNLIIEFFKKPETYYYIGGGLILLLLLYFIFKKKSSTGTSTLDSLIKNFLSIVIVSVLTLQIFLARRTKSYDNKLKKNVKDLEDESKDLDKIKYDIENKIGNKESKIEKIQDKIKEIEKLKDDISKETKTSENDISKISKKLKNL
jgi:DNA repair exonuclease SbcCD ATPase subunit